VTTRFLHHLAAAIAAGEAHLADADDELEPPPQPQRCALALARDQSGPGDIGLVGAHVLQAEPIGRPREVTADHPVH
jgi:hypothetical protein